MSLADALAELDATGTPSADRRHPSAAHRFIDLYADDHGRIGKRMSRCAEVLGDLADGHTMHVVSMGEWSADHMISWGIDQIGPADLLFGTWSLSVEPATRLCRAADHGLIRSLRGVFDLRAVIRRPEAMRMIRKRFGRERIRIFNCHAKVYLLSNETRQITIVSSANFTMNPRIEASVVTMDRAAFDFHHGWLSAVYADADPFECEDKPGREDAQDAED